MAKFILGVLVGLTIGTLTTTYFSNMSLDDLTVKARAELGRHMRVNN